MKNRTVARGESEIIRKFADYEVSVSTCDGGLGQYWR